MAGSAIVLSSGHKIPALWLGVWHAKPELLHFDCAADYRNKKEVGQALVKAMKIVVSEPSVGLYFEQQHVHKVVPSFLNVKHQITEATTSADLATTNVKDSLSCIKSMKDCGPLVIEQMIKSLQTASTQIPTNCQSRGSFSQLLPRPIRLSRTEYCGHVARLMCALECQLAGMVWSISADDVIKREISKGKHVVQLLDSLRFINCRFSIEKNFGAAQALDVASLAVTFKGAITNM
ncbi:hypothetical protein L7F22_065338 [Adiantum nelumboides]|nr:hypothetical protein [Adiantum nelumboides]